jgi:endogenous inhibitor of DNA gyrase (YacG/DUF329 family)
MSEKAGAKACPICGKPAQPNVRPFCSARCADVDLGRWLSDVYLVPGPPAGSPDFPEPEEEPPEG